MAERDDPLSRHYRELAREEPPAALDAAILAAARRAPGARAQGLRRWAGPLSIAAVLVLGIGVTLRMQMERPGIESSAPASAPSEYQMAPSAEPSAEPEAAAPVERRAPATPAPAPAPPPPLAREPASESRVAAPARATAPQAFAPAPAAVPAPATAPAPAPAAAPTPAAAPASAAEASAGAAPQPAARARNDALREKSAASLDKREAARDGSDPATVELERIARLRADGRHAEADKALEEFRRAHPDYRIAEAMWLRVKPR